MDSDTGERVNGGYYASCFMLHAGVEERKRKRMGKGNDGRTYRRGYKAAALVDGAYGSKGAARVEGVLFFDCFFVLPKDPKDDNQR